MPAEAMETTTLSSVVTGSGTSATVI
jgi:hypothetical protein